MAHKEKVDDLDRDLNAELDEALAKTKPFPASAAKEIQAAARRTLAKMHGGVRPGAGRKPLGKVRLQTLVKPETLRVLREGTSGLRGIGAVIDAIVLKVRHKDIVLLRRGGGGMEVIRKKKRTIQARVHPKGRRKTRRAARY